MSTSKKTFFKETMNNEQGVALLMVMGVIAILTFLLADFTFETKLNKIKIYNQQDKIQARLNAESGLNFALAKLRLYQEGRNRIEKDEGIKSAFPSSDLESVLIEPFIFPPPVSAKAGVIQRTAAEDFIKKTLFNGEVSVTISKVSGLLNPNGLRFQAPKSSTGNLGQLGTNPDAAAPEEEKNDNDPDAAKKNEPAYVIIEKKFVETLSRIIKDKNDNDENFHQRYANVDPAYLVQELKYYVSDRGTYQGSELQEIEAKFSSKNLTAKYGPMSSIDELYLLPSWDDALVDLVKDRMSVHDVSVIAVNEITMEDLKILFPAINSIQIEEFFKYRDGDVDKKIRGKKFKNAADFKRVVTGELNIISDAEYDERINTLKNAGLVIDTAGKLYKISSRGTMNNAVYNLVAYVDLPIKPEPKKPAQQGQQTPQGDQTPEGGVNVDAAKEPAPGGNKEEKPKPVELLRPRVVEIRLE